MKKAKDEVHHLAYIDAVRGLAFLGVLALHSSSAIASFPGRGVLHHGYLGVQLFFLASAVTLCYSASERQHRDTYPWVFFYIRRFFRIAPLFWLAIIFYWTMPGTVGNEQRNGLLWWSPTGIHPWYFALTALFMHGWHPYTFNSIVPGGWSIAVEMTFYVFFPLIFIYVNSLQRSVLVLLGYFALSPLFQRGQDIIIRHFYPNLDHRMVDFFQERWFPCSLPVFLVGFCTYYVLKGNYGAVLRKSRLASITVFISCLLILVHFLRREEELLIIVMTMAALIVSLASPRLPWVVNPVLCYIGRVSYSCYLSHFFMLGVVLNWLNPHSMEDAIDWGGAGHNGICFLFVFLMALLLTVVVSTITYHLVEKPGITLGRWIIHRIERLARSQSSEQKDCPAEKLPSEKIGIA